MNLVDNISAVLENGTPSEQADATRLAAFLIEKASGRQPCGWDLCVVDEPVDQDTIPQLRKALTGFVERHLEAPPVASAIAALVDLHDPTLKSLFRRALAANATWGADTGVLHQAIVALDRLGEPIIPENGGLSLTEVKRNLQLAHTYLNQIEPGGLQNDE